MLLHERVPAGHRTVLAFFLLTVPVSAQSPLFTPDSIVNSASYAPPGRIVPGEMLTIFGQNLAGASESAASYPFPRELGGTSVEVAGVAAPLLYISPGQINLVVPTQFSEPLTAAHSPRRSDENGSQRSARERRTWRPRSFHA